MFNYLINEIHGDDNAIDKFTDALNKLMRDAFGWMIGIAFALIAVWAAYIGFKWVTAKKAEQQVEAKKMVKQFVVGVFVIFILAVGAPLLIQTLISWYQKSGGEQFSLSIQLLF